MSLFDDNDKVGLAMIILAVVTFVMAIVGVVLVFTNDGDKLPGILSAIGSALAGVIYFGFGKKLRNNEFTGKMNILVAFIKVTALVTLINGISSYSDSSYRSFSSLESSRYLWRSAESSSTDS